MTPLEVDIAFDNIWSFWLNKESEHAAKKALSVSLNSGAKYQDIYKACRIYALDHAGDEFTYKLSNFLMRDDWKDTLEGADLNKLEAQRRLAIEIIEAWNKVCKPHWSKVLDIEDRIPLAKKALTNKYFADNWRESLDLISRIFKSEFNDNDNRSKININFRWFTNTQPDKHTVLKAKEGDYGKPFRDITRTEKTIRILTSEERKKAMELFNEVFRGETKPPSLDDFD
jgi:hypothetical protein